MSRGAEPLIRCSTHAEAVAGWHCPLCASELCRACAGLTDNGVVVCVKCGTLASVHLAPRGEVFPFSQVWPASVREVLSPAGLLQIIVLATACHFCFTVGKYFWIAGCLASALWVVNLARRAALGMNAFGLPEWEDVRLVLVGPLLRFSGVAVPLAVGAMQWNQRGLVAPPLNAPWTWVLAAATLIFVPPALAIATVEGPGRSFAWPWRLGQWVRRLGSDLRPLQLAVAMAVVLELFESRLPPANRELEDMQMLWHLFESWVPRLFSFAAMAAFGTLTGLLVFTRAGQFEHRRSQDDLVPSLTEPPTGRYVPPHRDLEAEATARAQKFLPIAIDESQQLSAIERGAREEAIAAYRSGELRAAQLELEPGVTLAQWLAGQGDFLGAANLLRVVTARVGGEDHAFAKALVVLARLCAERLDAQTEALRLYEDVVRRFPESSAARFAAEQLAARR